MANELTVVEQRDKLKGQLAKMEASLGAILPKAIKPHTFIHAILGSFHKTPKLYQCDSKSIMRSIALLAQVGIFPDTAFNHAYLIPYKTTCTVIFGYQGLVELALRSGMSGSPESFIIYSDEPFSIEQGSEGIKITHTPRFSKRPELFREDGEPTDEFIGAYCVWPLVVQGHIMRRVHFMPAREIAAIRKTSLARAYNKAESTWVKHPVQMVLKTPLRGCSKFVPKSAEMATAIEWDNAADIGEENLIALPYAEEAGVVEEAEEPTKSDRLAAQLNGNGKKTAPPPDDVPPPEDNSFHVSGKPLAPPEIKGVMKDIQENGFVPVTAAQIANHQDLLVDVAALVANNEKDLQRLFGDKIMEIWSYENLQKMGPAALEAVGRKIRDGLKKGPEQKEMFR